MAEVRELRSPPWHGLVNVRMGHQVRRWVVALALGVSSVLVAACTAPVRTPTPRPTPTMIPLPTLFPPYATPSVPVAPSPTPIAQLPLGSVPYGFLPKSVTFVSLSMGWVLGSAPCDTTKCLVLLETTDSGRTWTSRPVPPATPATIGDAAAGGGVGAVRFADAEDGWLFGPDLWSTHDGGVHWTRQALPGDPTMTLVEALETARGVVHAVLYDFAASPEVKIESSPTGRDAWILSKVGIELGAGPVAQAQLVVQGSGGWIVENDRGVVGGARLVNGAWRPWQPPCDPVHDGSASLAAATANDLVALCNNSFVGPPGIRIYTSHDGGSTFLRSNSGPSTLGLLHYRHAACGDVGDQRQQHRRVPQASRVDSMRAPGGRPFLTTVLARYRPTWDSPVRCRVLRF